MSIVGDEQIRQQRDHEEQLQNMYAAHEKEKQDLAEGNSEELQKIKQKFEDDLEKIKSGRDRIDLFKGIIRNFLRIFINFQWKRRAQ